MLQREHSDFAWFHERTQSLHSDSLSVFTGMASTAVEGQLNPEPSQPQERAEHDLPLKSYADAINEPTNQNGDAYGTSCTAANGPAHEGLVNDQTKQLGEYKFAYQKHHSEDDTTSLTSVKPSGAYEESLKHNGLTAPREKKSFRPVKRQDKTDAQLASGRRAGAGWETSAYGTKSTFPTGLLLIECRTEYGGHH